MDLKMMYVRPDSKGRITLGKLTEGVSRFRVQLDPEGRIFLEPLVEISAKEKWLFENKKALHRVQKGLEDSAKKRIKSLRSFSKFTQESNE